MTEFPEYCLWVGGRFISDVPKNPVLNPFNGDLVGWAPYANGKHLRIALEAAISVKNLLGTMPLYERSAKLEAVSHKILEKKEIYARIIASEAAKPLHLARLEVQRAAFVFKIAAQECLRPKNLWVPLEWNENGKRMEGMLRNYPAGLVLAISPFNFPLNLAVHKIAPALAAGCPIIAKPASKTPLTLLELAKDLAECDWPKGSISILNTSGDNIFKFAKERDIAVVSFTGSANVGWRLKENLTRKKVFLELGGNAAAIISESADLSQAMFYCWPSCFNYSGQICIHLQRLYVHKTHYKFILDELIHYAKTLIPSHPLEEDTRFSSMISDEEAQRVHQWILDAKNGGAILHTPLRRERALMWPCILSKTSKGMKVLDEEVFGPVVCVEVFEDFHEILQRVNDTSYGLQAALFSNNLSEVNQFFETVRAGNLIVNRSPGFRIDHMPYGGL